MWVSIPSPSPIPCTRRSCCRVDYVQQVEKIFLKDITETLKEFYSININSAVLASKLNTIKPRKYSIASSPGLNLDTEKTGNILSLIVGVLEYRTETGRVKRGLTTGMLETMSLNTRLLGSIKNANKSNFKLPEDPTWPVRVI
mgnify:CR=1 FL=1